LWGHPFPVRDAAGARLKDGSPPARTSLGKAAPRAPKRKGEWVQCDSRRVGLSLPKR
jgi:hypothetical protein